MWLFFIFISKRVHIVFTLPDYYNYNIKSRVSDTQFGGVPPQSIRADRLILSTLFYTTVLKQYSI